MSLEFNPSAARGRLVDETVRLGLAESISVLSQPILAERPDFRPHLARWVASLRAGPVPPGVFAVYSDVIESVFSEDEPAFLSAMNAFGEMDGDAADELWAVTLADNDLGPGMVDRFVRHFDDDPATPVAVAPLSANELTSARKLLAETCLLLHSAAPDLVGEIRRLVRNIIFVASEPGSGKQVFQGGSTFYL